jgi:hypothetical protein
VPDTVTVTTQKYTVSYYYDDTLHEEYDQVLTDVLVALAAQEEGNVTQLVVEASSR